MVWGDLSTDPPEAGMSPRGGGWSGGRRLPHSLLRSLGATTVVEESGFLHAAPRERGRGD